MLGDLHMHSIYSDGDYSPAEVAQKCFDAGCQIVALSDHDSIAGVEQMNVACKKVNIINIPAIEISAYDGCEIHVLGYNINYELQGFKKFLSKIENEREKRALLMLERLADYKIYIDREDLKKIARNLISRTHIATAIAQKGYEKDSRTAFEKWLSEGSPAYVKSERMHVEEAIAQIKQANGSAVLAHPVRIKKTLSEKAQLVKQMVQQGLDGIEALYKNSSAEATAFYTDLAERFDLFITNGGDFHGDRNCIQPRKLSEKALECLMSK